MCWRGGAPSIRIGRAPAAAASTSSAGARPCFIIVRWKRGERQCLSHKEWKHKECHKECFIVPMLYRWKLKLVRPMKLKLVPMLCWWKRKERQCLGHKEWKHKEWKVSQRTGSKAIFTTIPSGPVGATHAVATQEKAASFALYSPLGNGRDSKNDK